MTYVLFVALRLAMFIMGGWLLGRYTGDERKYALHVAVIGLLLVVAASFWAGYSFATVG